MRTLLLASVCIMFLAGCTSTNMNAANASGQQTADQNPNAPDPAGPYRDDRRTIPWQFRRPPPQSGLWGGPGLGYGGMY